MWRVFPAFAAVALAVGVYYIFRDNEQAMLIYVTVAIAGVIAFVVGKSVG